MVGRHARLLRLDRLIALLLLAATGLPIEPGPVAAAEGDLFRETLTAQGGQPPADPTVVRSRNVEVDLGVLGTADARGGAARPASNLTLNLFSDVKLTAILDRAETANATTDLTWVGHVRGVDHSLVTLVVKDGVVAGNVSTPAASYQVRYAGNGAHTVREINRAAFPDEQAPRLPKTPPQPPANDTVGAAADDGSQIDVLVVYTAAARSAVGGTTSMTTLINLAVTEANTSYGNSGVSHRLRLAHAAEVDYRESGDMSTDLERLTERDGVIDNVHSLRDTHKADLVSLFTHETGPYCGIAWLMDRPASSFQSSGFSVVAQHCATGNYSFGHELGHNMGARHDRVTEQRNGTPPTANAYNYGYVASNNAWRTIMAYGSACGGCPRLPYWSNPDKQYGGLPMGVPAGRSDAADDHRTLNENAVTVANFRTGGGSGPTQPGPTQPGPRPTSRPSGTITMPRPTYTWPAVGGASAYRLMVTNATGRPVVYQPGLQARTVCSGSVCSYTPATSLASGRYNWKVQPVRAGGSAAWGAATAFTVNTVTGFQSSFNGSAQGWDTHRGTWSLQSGTSYRTRGVAGQLASISQSSSYTDFDYQVRLRRTDCDTCANRLIVRGNPGELSEGFWSSGYSFQFVRTGYYSVWKSTGGTHQAVQSWTPTPAINPGSDWNVLRVRAVGGTLQLYINNALVWTGADTSLKSGRVGIGMYADTASDDLVVDSAKLSPIHSNDGKIATEEPPPTQEAFNDVFRDQPAKMQRGPAEPYSGPAPLPREPHRHDN